MKLRQVLHLWAGVPFLLGVGILPSLALSLAEGDGLAPVYLQILVLMIALAGLARWLGSSPERVDPPLGHLVVVVAWIGAGVLGALPYLMGAALPRFTAAIFESVSGFTATGSTMLTAIEEVPRSLLLWRSLTHWVGGIGIILMVLAVLPRTVGSRMLYGAEAPLSLEAQPQPRFSAVIRSYLAIYAALTAIQVVLLWLGPMDLFEAVCHSFAAIAGGGFSTRSLSIGAWDDLYTEIVLMVFMLAGATSFYAHLRAVLERSPRVYLKNGEIRLFMGIVAVSTVLVAGDLVVRQGLAVGQALRGGAFQVVSIITTTGFATEDFELWPVMPQVLLILLMFVGGCSASTSGSIKVVRYQVTAKSLFLQVRRHLHPNLVHVLRLGTRVIRPEQVEAVQLYFLAYLGLATISVLGLSVLGVDGATSITAVAATLGNVGPGLGTVGPFDNFAHLPEAASWILILCMLAGRLEILGLATLFLPELWRYGRPQRRGAATGSSFMLAFNRVVWSAVAALFAVTLLVGCSSEPQSYPRAHPVVEATELSPLRQAVESAHEQVEKANARLSSDDAAAREDLQRALHQLDDLRWYYLPLMEAREAALNAYREAWAGDDERRDRFLAQTRRLLLQVVERAGPQVDKMVEKQLEILADAEAEAHAGHDPRPQLEKLASEIVHAVQEAPLVLGENRYHLPDRKE